MLKELQSFFKYLYKNYHKKVSAVLSSWSKEYFNDDNLNEKSEIISKMKEIFSELLNVKAISQIDSLKEIYLNYLSDSTLKKGELTAKDGTVRFFNIKLIKVSSICAIFSATMEKEKKNKEVILKAYLHIANIPNQESAEEKYSRFLYSKKLNVVKWYEKVETNYWRIYPMKRIEYTANILLDSEYRSGFEIATFVSIVKSIVPIIKELHSQDVLYIDFAPANIALEPIDQNEKTDKTNTKNYNTNNNNNKQNTIKKYKIYLLDFGALIKSRASISPSQYTIRYASRKSLEGKANRKRDDYEAFAYTLLDCYYGFDGSPLGPSLSDVPTTIATKSAIFTSAALGNLSPFFNSFFQLLSSDNNNNSIDENDGDYFANEILKFVSQINVDDDVKHLFTPTNKSLKRKRAEEEENEGDGDNDLPRKVICNHIDESTSPPDDVQTASKGNRRVTRSTNAKPSSTTPSIHKNNSNNEGRKAKARKIK